MEQVKRAGRRLRTEHLDVRALVSLLLHPRIAIVVGKQGHTIVERNRLRRRLRELARTKLIPEIGGLDLVVRTTPAAYDATFDQLRQEVDTLISRLQAAK